jgi:hypothetical protein
LPVREFNAIFVGCIEHLLEVIIADLIAKPSRTSMYDHSNAIHL